MVNKLEKDEALIQLRNLKDWEISPSFDKIAKNFVFKDFKTAFEFMQKIAEKAEAMNHHPEWLNVYNRLHVTLTTHDCGGLSLKDFTLAHFMDHLFENREG